MEAGQETECRGLESQAVIDTVQEALSSYGASLVRNNGYVYQFIITDAENQAMVLDLKHLPGSLRPGLDPKADVKVHIRDCDLLKLADGTLSVTNAMWKGHLQVEGDHLGTYVLTDTLGIIKRRQENGGKPDLSSVNSEESARRWRIGVSITLIVVIVYLFVFVHRNSARTGGGPRDLEKIAHMKSKKLSKLEGGAAAKLLTASNGIFKQLIGGQGKAKSKFEARSSDVFITGAIGSGTTWISHIMHGLRSNGSMDFEDITEVVPWFDTIGSEAGQVTLRSQNSAHPRLFKTHKQYERLPQGGRYVVVLRDPEKVMLSQYRFFVNGTWGAWAGLRPGEMSLPLFAAAFFASANTNDVWNHIVSWYQCCWHDHRTIWVTYEDLLEDPGRQIRRLAKFLLPKLPSQEVLKRVEMQATRDFMLQHVTQFDDHSLLGRLELAERAAKQGHGVARMPHVLPHTLGVQVPYGVQLLLDARWERMVEPLVKFQSYAELRDAIQIRAAPQYGAVGTSLQPAGHLWLASVLLLGFLALAVCSIAGLAPYSLRSAIVRLLVLARLYRRRCLSIFWDSTAKKVDEESEDRKSGFTV